ALLVTLSLVGTAVAAPPPAPSPSHVVVEHFASKALGVDKHVVVYLPRGYDSQPRTRWPVFYYLHGLGGDETNWTAGMHLDQAADKLGLAAIIVMPDGDDGFYFNSATPIDYDQCMKDGTGLFSVKEPHDTTCVRQRSYGSYIAEDLVQWVDKTYRTIAKREGRGIAGLSMGGFGAIDHALRDHAFAAAASHSGAIELRYIGPHPYVAGQAPRMLTEPSKYNSAGQVGAWIAKMFGQDIATWKAHDIVGLLDTNAAAFKDLALYFDCGSEDDFQLDDNLKFVHEQLTAHKIAHEFFIGPGHHNAAFWTARAPFSLQFLRDHVAKPTN
ncbi:MAG TPA: alpha/beta hydrolase-fold protein, partial [Kofleriaceae bacterium]